MARVGDFVRVTKPTGMCCGTTLGGTTAEIIELYHTSPFSKNREIVYGLDTGDIVRGEQIEVLKEKT